MKIISIFIILCIFLVALFNLFNYEKCFSDKYKGQQYAMSNQLKNADECIGANHPSFELPKVSDDFIKGCEAYLK